MLVASVLIVSSDELVGALRRLERAAGHRARPARLAAARPAGRRVSQPSSTVAAAM